MSGPITFGSVCSGIEAASEAFLPLGWRCAFVSETDKQASAVLAHHYPETPNLGDMELIDGSCWSEVDVLIGGTPCQSFSLAGKRRSLSDERGNLALSFVRLANAINAVRQSKGERPLVVVWENVRGVLSTSDNAFGCFLGGFVGCDSPVVSSLERGRWPDAGMVAGPLARVAWRVLDAQYFGLAQRRERVLVVISFGDGPDPAAILFEPRGLSRNPPARREAGKDIAGTLGGSSQSGGFRTTDLDNQGAFIAQRIGVPDVAWALQERDSKGPDSDTKDGHLIVELERGVFAADARQITSPGNRSIAREELAPTLGPDSRPLVFNSKSDGSDVQEDISQTLRAMNHDDSNANGGGQMAVAFKPSHFTRGKDGAPSDVHPPLSADADKGDQEPVIFQSRSYAVRRLLPVECERLQGFPDGHTLVPWKGKEAFDSARYRQLGNSMPVPMIAWLGRRIEAEIWGQK